MKRYNMFIGGEFVPPSSGQWFPSENPFTGAAWAEIPQGNKTDVDDAVNAAHAAFTQGEWAEYSATQRGALLRVLGDLIKRDAQKLAEIEVTDNGKLFAEMYRQLTYLPEWFYYYGGLADKVQGSTIPLDKSGYFNFTTYEPLGVVAVITPWNSPLLLTAWKIAPALAAGCCVVIKPSEFTSASILEFVTLCNEAGFPPGVINVVTGFGSDVGTPLVTHPLVKKISFTGSDATGRAINVAGAEQFKRVTLELGGKSPNIVFADASLEDAANGVIAGIFSATGQTCIAGSRLLVQDDIYDSFLERLLVLARQARMGDPMSSETQVGPITTRQQYDKVLSYIAIARAEGARMVLGDETIIPAQCHKGWFIPPAIFTDVKNEMRIAQEEVFGPVLSVIRFSDEEDAVQIANDTCYGLGAGVWTKDIGLALRMSKKIQAGTVWVNTYRVVSFMSPFGGYKSSGFGRENGIDAIYEYLQVKSVWVNSGALSQNPFVIK